MQLAQQTDLNMGQCLGKPPGMKPGQQPYHQNGGMGYQQNGYNNQYQQGQDRAAGAVRGGLRVLITNVLNRQLYETAAEKSSIEQWSCFLRAQALPDHTRAVALSTKIRASMSRPATSSTRRRSRSQGSPATASKATMPSQGMAQLRMGSRDTGLPEATLVQLHMVRRSRLLGRSEAWRKFSRHMAAAPVGLAEQIAFCRTDRTASNVHSISCCLVRPVTVKPGSGAAQSHRISGGSCCLCWYVSYHARTGPGAPPRKGMFGGGGGGGMGRGALMGGGAGLLGGLFLGSALGGGDDGGGDYGGGVSILRLREYSCSVPWVGIAVATFA